MEVSRRIKQCRGRIGIALVASILVGVVAYMATDPVYRFIGYQAKALPNGYKVVKAHGDLRVIVAPAGKGRETSTRSSEAVVGPYVVEVWTKGRWIYGRVEDRPHDDGVGWQPGWFVIDSESGAVIDGMTEEAAMQKLK